MKKFILASLAILLMSGCTKTPEENIDSLYQDGLSQIDDFQIGTADSTFKKIFEIDPGSMKGVVGISKVFDARLQYFDAVKSYSFILANNTDYEEAFVGLYYAYKNLGFYHEALETAVHYNKLWNENAHTKFILGDAYKNLDEFQRAKTYFTQAHMSGYKNKQAAQLMLATVNALEGQKMDAEREAKEAFADQQDEPIFYNAAAEYYETIGNIDSANFYNTKLFEYKKSDIQNVYTSLKRALKHNYLADARSIILSLEKLEADPLVIEGLKLFYGLHIDDKSLIRMHGQNYKAYSPHSLTGTMYELYSRAEISDKLTMGQDLSLLETEIAKGQYSDEFGAFYYYAMFMLNVKYEKNPTVIAKLESIEGLRVNRKVYRLEYALTKHVIGLFEECYNDLEKLEASHSTNADWLTSIGETWRNIAIRKYDRAEELYKKALEVDKYYRPAFEKYLTLLTDLKKYDEALKLYDTYPQFSEIYDLAFAKTKYYYLNEKYDEALAQFKEFVPYVSGNIVFVNELVDILKDDKRDNEINQLLESINKNNSDSYELLATVAQDKNEFEQSMAHLDKGLSIEPTHPQLNILRARALYYLGNKTEAYDQFDKNLLEFPNNPQNLLFYSQILAAEGIDLDKASNMARQAAFEGYGHFEYLISLADIYYTMGKFDLCRGETSKIIKFDRKNPYPFFRYGMACMHSKDKNKWVEDGKKALNHAIELGLSGDNLKEAQEALN